jgi:endoglucanase
MLDSATVHRQAVLETLRGMTNYLRTAVFPPSEVAWDGKVINRLSGPGFSAAILPFLMALDERRLLNANVQRLKQEKDSLSGLYGHIPSYYDQNLALFGTGFADGRFRFNHRGDLLVNWSPL